MGVARADLHATRPRTRASAGRLAVWFESQNRSHGEGLLRVSETTPGRGAAFSCGVFRTAGAAEAGGGQPATVVAARATADRDDVGSASRLARDDYGERGLAIARLGGGYGFRVRSLRTG